MFCIVCQPTAYILLALALPAALRGGNVVGVTHSALVRLVPANVLADGAGNQVLLVAPLVCVGNLVGQKQIQPVSTCIQGKSANF